jgi:hypothetical protein
MSNLISMNMNAVEGEIGSLMSRFNELPKHIAKKHLQSSMKKALKSANAVQVLKSMTPKQKSRVVFHNAGPAGEYGATKVKGGALRRAVILKSKFIGRNSDGVVVAAVGYKFGSESRKALWLEFGTSRGVKPQRMAERAMSVVRGPALASLTTFMAAALEKAANELESKKNPGYQGK